MITHTQSESPELVSVAQKICRSQRTVVITGAGISAESGIPTFRDSLTGLWEQFDPLELATPEAYCRNPSLVWGWYEWRRMKVLKVPPTPAIWPWLHLQHRFPNSSSSPRMWTTCTNGQAARQCFTCMAACTTPAVLNATTPTPWPLACPKNQKEAAPSHPRAAANVAARSAPALSGLAKACPHSPGSRPWQPSTTATCSSASAPPVSSTPLPHCPK